MRFREKAKTGQGMSRRMAKRICRTGWYGRWFRERGMTAEYLRLLHPGERMQEVLEAYHVEKLSRLLTGAGLAVLLAAAGIGWNIWQAKEREIVWVPRPGYLQGERQEVWEVTGGNGERERIRMRVSEQLYTEEETKKRLSAAASYLDGVILGENESADRVEYPLVFPQETPQEGVAVQWSSGKPEVLDGRGRIASDHLAAEGVLVPVRAVLSTQSQELTYERTFRVYPAKRDAGELFYAQVQAALRETEERTREAEGFALPEQIAGEAVVFRRPAGKEFFLLAVLGLAVCLLAYVNRDEKTKKAVERRTEQLLADYPELVSKLTVLLRAGLTARAACGRIMSDYRKRREGDRRYAYEELTIAYYEMVNGVPEDKAYEQFGRRCGLIPYMRLGGMLAQNVRKGNKSLLQHLNREAQEAFEERKRRAKKAGEEAGTRMLVPMALMLLVTIVLILYPAFASFQI